MQLPMARSNKTTNINLKTHAKEYFGATDMGTEINVTTTKSESHLYEPENISNMYRGCLRVIRSKAAKDNSHAASC
jgi:hypothetical protein